MDVVAGEGSEVTRVGIGISPPDSEPPDDSSWDAHRALVTRSPREVYRQAGFREVRTQIVPTPLRLSSAAECVRFERESFGALHQMLSGLPESERGAVWEEIEEELRKFEGPDGFEGPCEMVVGAGVKQDG